MKLDDYRIIFVASTLVLILIATYPSLTLVITSPRGSEEFFTEFSILGPQHLLDGYPSDVIVNERYQVFINVDNHLGKSAYYLIYVKFRNQYQPLPNMSSSTASSVSPLYEFRFAIDDGGEWYAPVNFALLDIVRLENSRIVRQISINGVIFPVDSLSTRSSENEGFQYQLFFELWLYNENLKSFEFNNRFVGIWLNIVE